MNINQLLRSLTIFFFALLVGQASAFTYTISAPNDLAIADDPTLAGATVYNFFVSTPEDILLFAFDKLEPGANGEFYQHPIGDDAGPSNSAFVSIFPSLGLHSYITTPSSQTALAAAALPCGTGPAASIDFGAQGMPGLCELVWFDSENDGPQEDFRFAQLTLIGDDFINLEGTMLLRDDFAPTLGEVTFSISGRGTAISGATFVPEPAAGQIAVVFAFLSLGMLRRRRGRGTSKLHR